MPLDRRPPSLPDPVGQSGAALILALIFIVLLTMLGITAYGISSLEERMAGHSRDRLLAFQAAEAALRYCEDNSKSLPLPTPTQEDAGRWAPTHAVWGTNSSHAYPTALEGVSTAPRCILEEVERKSCTGEEGLSAQAATTSAFLYRVTARGTGASPGTVVMLQTVFHACD